MMYLDAWLSVTDVELVEAETELIRYSTWSTDPAGVDLRRKLLTLKEKKRFLTTLKRGRR